MKHMKKLLAVVLAALLVLALAACGNNNTQNQTATTAAGAAPTGADYDGDPINVAAIKGPTGMGMAAMMDNENYNFTLTSDPTEVATLLATGKVDIAACPLNLAANLYKKTNGGVQMLAVNTLGVLYLLTNGETVTSISDLAGKTVYATGQGATPEYALNYILSANGIDPGSDVTIEWKSEHAECLAALLADEEGVALLPQPFVTTAQMKNSQVRVSLDLTEEWDRLQEGAKKPSALLTGVVAVRREFAEANPDAVAAFLDMYEKSTAFANENVEETAKLIGAYEIVPEAVAKAALPACNITFISGEEMKEKLSGYLSVLYEQNPKAVGGNMPEDDFYYMD